MIEGNVYYDSEDLWHLVREAEELEKEVYIHKPDPLGWVVSHVEIDGEEYVNDFLEEELYDDGWEREAEYLWRQ